MYKNLTILVLIATFALFAARSTGSAPPTIMTPIILKRVLKLNQTAPIPTTTLFTPTPGGLFRVSAYMTQTSPGTGTGSWNLELYWTDDAGQEYQEICFIGDKQVPSMAYCQSPLGSVLPSPAVFSANVGTPVIYDVTGDGQGGPYDLFIVAERLASP
jgi:hypothetical protein